MALEKKIEIDKIEIVENGILQIRQITRIIEDGEQLSSSYHRWSYPPGSDISDQPENIQAIAKLIWTKDVIAAYKQKLEVKSV